MRFVKATFLFLAVLIILAILPVSAMASRPPQVTLISPVNNANVEGARVVFQWDAAPMATKYELVIRKVSDNTLFRRLTLGNVTRLAVIGLPADFTQYKWQIRAGNASGWGRWSGFYKFKSAFADFDHEFNNISGYQGWLRRPQAVWSLDSQAMLTSGQVNRWVSARRANIFYNNFEYSANMLRINSENSSNGIVFRAGSKYKPNRQWYPGYHFLYRNDGTYSIWKSNKNGNFTALQSWTQSNHINKNGWNNLRVVAVNNDMRFLINGNLVKKVSDSTLEQGFVGVTSYRSNVDPANTLFLVNRVRLSRPMLASAEELDDIDPEQLLFNEAVEAEMAAGRVDLFDE